MVLAATNYRYPTGKGGVTATAADSLLATSRGCVIEQIQILSTTTADRTITIALRDEGADTYTDVMELEVASGIASPNQVKLGGAEGLWFPRGFSVKRSHGELEAMVLFRNIYR